MKILGLGGWPLALCAVIALAVGCGKKEASAPQNVTESTAAPAPAVPEMPKTVELPKPADVDKTSNDLAKVADAQKATETANISNDLTQKVAAAKAATEKATAVNTMAETLMATNATEKVQGLIDTAKQLIADNKFADALRTLTDLSKLKLTDTQQKMVDALKEQVNKSLANKTATEAGKALDGLLPK
ncbi:MAG: hypothetical protein M1608_16730 [Candidatus Omnitrophica bacterium]|nr:hypothetical protein [Candidatus Omnitrophota bacterium]